MRKRNPYTPLVGMKTGPVSMENSILKIDLLHDPAIPLLGKYTKNIKTLIQRGTWTPVFSAALFTTNYKSNLSA